MDKNNRNLLIAGIAIVVVIAIAIIVPHLKGSNNAASTAVVPSTVSDASDTAPATSADASMAMWTDLFQKYNGKIVVLSDTCGATPTTQTQAKNTTELLMNNSATPHTVTINGNVYKIGAYHYKTTYLNTVGTNSISCDSSANVATIAVQG